MKFLKDRNNLYRRALNGLINLKLTPCYYYPPILTGNAIQVCIKKILSCPVQPCA